jgi:hypothetical protein
MALTDVFQAVQKSLSFKKTAEISGIKFELGLLSFEEEIKAESLPQEGVDPLAYYNEARLQTLSYAVKSINGEDVPSVVDIKEGEASVKKQGSIVVKEFLSSLPLKIIDKLFEVYTDLKDQTEEDLQGKVKYNWFKTPEQRKEEENKKRNQEKTPEEPLPESPEQEDEEIRLREIRESPEEKNAQE